MLNKIKDLKNHSGFMKYFKNTSWLFGEKILRMAIGLFVGIWVVRYLGPEQFGLFSYAQSFVGLFAVIATLGLDGIVVRELVKGENCINELIGTAFWLKFIGALFVLLILAIAINFTSNDSFTNALVFIIASATIFQSFNVIDMYFQAKVLSKYVVYVNVVTLFISSIIKIVLILNEASLIAFVWVILFDSFILAVGLFFLKNSILEIKKLVFRKEMAVSLLRDSWPLIISGLALSIQSYIDQIMLKEMLGFAKVAYYSIAFKLMAIFGFLPMIIQSTFLPAIISTKKISPNLYRFRTLNFYRLMMSMFLVVSLPIYFFGESVVVLLYGGLYVEAGAIFAIFGFRLFFAFFGVGRSSYLLNENMQKYSLYTIALASFLNIILNYILIPIYGINGAMIATFVSFTFNIFIFDLIMRSTRSNVLLMIVAIFSFWKLKFSEVNSES
ncbi:polysaccharide biosynthesis protein [Candidatus Ruthia magnifica str. Cm (Calyptogena magnifica)]|uniref:Polysaccharide biosynthesis protein n=1 Tax=Ruthia magnifica subsp. Calyptogena magnifica TaxID=413404 RepID=A1AXF8_RUTMC|nr:flippase [Candidatus Ruthturnera calyptogenae]ABL02615.1 polysaccharide biosynthesis protein [Candidatus Ruthia magnifica str. Cm (Calyptogena magnifica)]